MTDYSDGILIAYLSSSKRGNMAFRKQANLVNSKSTWSGSAGRPSVISIIWVLHDKIYSMSLMLANMHWRGYEWQKTFHSLISKHPTANHVPKKILSVPPLTAGLMTGWCGGVRHPATGDADAVCGAWRDVCAACLVLRDTSLWSMTQISRGKFCFSFEFNIFLFVLHSCCSWKAQLWWQD